MEYRKLGRTGIKVSTLCLGCMMFGGRTDEESSMDIVDRALDEGINFLDTANVYSRGESERVVGKALQRNGKRDQIVLATKVFGGMADDDPNAQWGTRRHIIEQCEASLRRLQTDYIDLYQIHRPSSEYPIDETLRALDDLIRGGKVRYIGTSTFAAWQVVESLWASKELGLNRFVSEQPPYHILDRRVERELIPVAQTYDIGIIPWSPLAGGFLTGKYERDEARPEDSRFARNREWGERHFTDAAFDVVDVVRELAADKEVSPAQFSLAWVAAQAGVTSPIIGPRTMEQLKDNLGALAVELTEEDMARIDEVAPAGRAVVSYYGPEQGGIDFGPHPYRW